MKKKSKLASKPQYRKVYVFDDLTRLRTKLLHKLQEDDEVKTAYTFDGRIVCTQKSNETKKHKIESYDLFHLGWGEEKLREYELL